ncbi:hypothetical protein F5148DRAFT_144121 [Russula earlei]|uniref:Uncharacterized protein n=1 Tax=Russula earlei TaxID=71964 RepID=A0ACC0U6G8_9AGAM|nr:hypothetical protein F5148DRAFT_144121 [Russula earlei]
MKNPRGTEFVGLPASPRVCSFHVCHPANMSFSDFYASDLTDITSSDDGDEFIASKAKPSSVKKSTHNQRSSYTILNALRPPRSTSYSVRALYEQIIDGSINLDPDYQRDIVWSEQKQIGLIDSIFRNYYIPPIIFAVSTTEDGSETRVCIDGKQRLTSIQKITAKRYWCKKYGTAARLLLPPPLQQSFSNKQIVCVEYDSLTDEQEREIFQRVQLGVALTPAERLQAIVGPWPSFIREVQSHVLGIDGFGNSFDWGRARGRDFHGLASIVYLIEQLPACKAPPTTQTMEKWLTRTTPVPPKLRTGVLDTFRVYLALVREATSKKPFAQRVSPIEFIMIGLMIFMKRETLSLTQLSHAVEKMRTDVRAEEKDVRSNGRVCKLLFKFIVEKLPRLTLRSDNEGDKSAQSTLPPLPRTPTTVAPPVLSSQSAATAPAPSFRSGLARLPPPKKRKRRVEPDNDPSYSGGGSDSEYVPTQRISRRSVGQPPAKILRPLATAESHPTAPEALPPPGPAPSLVTDTAVNVEDDKSITPTPSLTPVVSSTSSQSAPPASPPLTSPQIKIENTEPLTVLGLHRTPMGRLAALRAAGARSSGASGLASTSPTVVSPTADVPPDQPVPGSAVAPINLEALDNLQQLLSLSAGLKTLSTTSPQQQTQALSPPAWQGVPSEDLGADNLNTALALQQLQALLSSQQQQQVQQTQDPPNAIPIPHPAVAAQLPVKPTLNPTVNPERIESSLPAVPKIPIGPRNASGLTHGLKYRRYRSRSRDYDHRNGPRREYDYERGREYHRRGRSRSRSYSRSRSRSWSRSRSRSHPRDYRSSRSRSWDRERDYGYHSAGSVHRGRDWRARPGHVGAGGDAVDGMGGDGGGPGPSNTSVRASSPGYAPRKFDFRRERARREREYEEYLRSRRTSGGGDGPGPGQRQWVHGGGGVFLR